MFYKSPKINSNCEYTILTWCYTGLVLTALYTSSNGSTTTTPVYISGFFSFSGSWESRNILPAVEMALDHINKDPRILPEYELKMIWNDTECDPNTATYTLYDQLNREPTKVAILGGGCSVSTRPIAANSGFWNLTSVSYAASSPSLSDREQFPYFFRTIVPDSLLNPARLYLMEEFGWNRVATLHGQENIFVSAVDDLENRLQKANITLISGQAVTSRHVYQVIESLKNDDTKIIAMNMYASRARQIFCEAYRHGMIEDGYVWMILGWYGDKWWEEPNNDDELLRCDIEEMRDAIYKSYYISIEMQQLDASGAVSIANITADEYKQELLDDYLTLEKFDGYEYHPDSPLGYDAAWAIALMLHNASKVFNAQEKSLTDFTYTDHKMATTFFNVLRDVTFTGVSGNVGFDAQGNRMGIVQIRQLQPECEKGWILHQSTMCVIPLNDTITESDAEQYCTMQGANHTQCPYEFSVMFCCKRRPDCEERVVARYKEAIDDWEWAGNFTWPGGQKPTDKTPSEIVKIRKNAIVASAYVPFYVMSALGIIMCIVLITFNTKYRKERYIKLSSPGMNNIIILGGCLIYMATIPSAFSNRDISMTAQYWACQLRSIFLTLGFTLSFGAMITKTWRIYKVAVFQTAPKRVVITNKQLYIVLGVIVGIAVFMIILLCAFEKVEDVVIKMDTNVTNKEIHMFYNYCFNTKSLLQIPVWGFNCILVIIGIFLAFQTRQVNIDGLNDSKLIGICIYKLGLLSFIYIMFTVLSENNPMVTFVVTSSIYVYYTTFTLLMIFVPKIKHVMYDEDAAKPASQISNTAKSREPSMADNISVDYDNLTDKLMKAESEVKRLKDLLSKYDKKDDPHSGCGIWCYGTVCGCCTSPDLCRITMATKNMDSTDTTSTRDIDHGDQNGQLQKHDSVL